MTQGKSPLGKRLLVAALAAWLGLVSVAEAKDQEKEKDKGKVSVDLNVNAPVRPVAPASIGLSANAWSEQANHPVVRVEYYQGTTLIGTAGTSPYATAWNGVAAGTYTLTAKAFNDKGDAAVSAPLSIAVNAPPTVALTAPGANRIPTAPASVTLSANATDSDGTIAKVEFYQGATLVGTAIAAPYAATWANAPAGNYTLTARATDNDGAVTTSAPVTIRIDAPPTVSITTPTAGQTLIAPASVTLTASASDSDGTVAKVEFFQGATLVGSATAAPYAATWANAPAGSYTLTARATDNDGAVTTSAPVTIRIDAPPAVSITSPTAGQTLIAPASVTLSANASDSDGTVAKVEFYQGATLVGTATAVPYAATWANAPAGSYTLTAQATDNDGAVGTSGAVVITVLPNQLPSVALSSPQNNQGFTAPASITLTANASDSDGTIAKVDFYQGTTRIGSATSVPYAATWADVPAGSYSLTARAIDSAGGESYSAAVAITVAPAGVKLYYLHSDHLNTPRLVTDEQNQVVWRNSPLSEPFGMSPPEEDPDGDDVPFTFNLRFPGQYFDRETNLHYNYFRDYDPEAGRYRQSDPIGLAGGINTYTYALGNPMRYTDPLGLWVYGVYDRTTGTLSLHDLENGTSISGPFESGGKPYGDPIPAGQYDILSRAGRDGFFRLEPVDSNYGDDTDDRSGRNHFRLHHPGRTLGCVAAKDEGNWNNVEKFINSTVSDEITVPSMSRNPWGPKTETLQRFGRIVVIH